MAKPDFMLAWLVNAANQGDIRSLGLTVSCQGTVVTGNMVSRGTYWSTVKERMEKKAGEKAGGFASALEDLSGAESRAEAATPETPQHLHLVDARVLFGGSVWPEDGDVPWKCRLESIDAWAIGKGV